MRVYVTGAGGFVGRHLVAHLRDAGDVVSGTDHASGGADILDAGAVMAEMRAASPEVVYHLAGQADVAESWHRPAATFRVNAEGTLNVLAVAADLGVHRVVVVSSAEVYGIVDPTAMPIAESVPLDPASPYAASKAAAEMVCIQWANRGLGVVRARAFNHLGPGQSERFVVAALAGRLVRARRSGLTAVPVGNLGARRDFTDVRDVVRAYRLLATLAPAGGVYNVCTGEDHPIAVVAGLLQERIDPGIELIPDPELQRPSDVPVLRGDPSLLQRTTGWKPEIPLARSLDDVVAAADAPLATGSEQAR